MLSVFVYYFSILSSEFISIGQEMENSHVQKYCNRINSSIVSQSNGGGSVKWSSLQYVTIYHVELAVY